MESTRNDPTRAVLMVTAIVIGVLATIIISREVQTKRHTVGELPASAREDTWYAMDDDTVYQSNLLVTTTVYMKHGQLRRKEFHIFNPVVNDQPATATQADAWRHFFGR